MNLAVNAAVQVPLIIGSVGIWLQGRKRRVAPALGFLSEFAWIAWEIYAGLWSVIPWSVLWAVLYARVWWKWRSS